MLAAPPRPDSFPGGKLNPTRNLAIEAIGIGRAFGTFTAVDDVSFAVQHGEVFGFLGPNGAGKSTTIKMLCTLLKPTTGTAVVNGYDIRSQPAEVRASLGIIFQDYSLDDRITAEENLRFHCMIYHVPKSERAERIKVVLDMVNLSDRAGDKVKTFSGGMKRRLEIARGLLHRPAVLFLDEPTVGLDPQTRRTIWEHVLELRKQEGITVFLTTHYMDEAEHCDRIGVMDHAKLIALDTPAGLKQQVGGDVVRLSTSDDRGTITFLTDMGITNLQSDDSGVRFELDGAAEALPSIIRRLPFEVTSMEVARPTLEDVFLKLTGRAIRDEGVDAGERLRSAFKRRGGRGM
ncbi:daunorubicin resistance protein DrrA family ABC transporter ATP-binding protein [soil metagenome]